MVKTPCFHCRGARVQFLVRELGSHICYNKCGQKKKKNHCICVFMTIGRAKFFSYIH